VLKLREDHGLTILLNSHLLGEVEQMCDRCVILKEGTKVYEGAVKRSSDELPTYQLRTPDLELAQRTLDAEHLHLTSDGKVLLNGKLSGAALVAKLVHAGVRVDSWSPHYKTLEDVYLELTNARPVSRP
jgi:ABC-2 type transport system ATP-binding protein